MWVTLDPQRRGSARHNAVMRFVLIRHAESENNRLFAETGTLTGRHPDPGLTDLGRDQARRLAEAVTAGVLPWRVTTLRSSLMTRALQTAAPLADALDLPVVGDLDIFEAGGPFTLDDAETRVPHPGADRAQLQSLTPRVVLPPEAGPDGWWHGPYEAATETVAARARRVFDGLRATHQATDVVALVAHAIFLQHLIRVMLEIAAMTGRIDVANTSISLLEDAPERDYLVARRLNWTPHLDGGHLHVGS